jgi:hypothetical protein
MPTPLIAGTVMTAVGWLVVPVIWRGREPGRTGGRAKDGPRASSWLGFPAVLLAMTFFMVAAWVVYLDSQPQLGGDVPMAGASPRGQSSVWAAPSGCAG